jgi:hypothetical protein
MVVDARITLDESLITDELPMSLITCMMVLTTTIPTMLRKVIMILLPRSNPIIRHVMMANVTAPTSMTWIRIMKMTRKFAMYAAIVMDIDVLIRSKVW